MLMANPQYVILAFVQPGEGCTFKLINDGFLHFRCNFFARSETQNPTRVFVFERERIDKRFSPVRIAPNHKWSRITADSFFSIFVSQVIYRLAADRISGQLLNR